MPRKYGPEIWSLFKKLNLIMMQYSNFTSERIAKGNKKVISKKYLFPHDNHSNIDECLKEITLTLSVI